MGGCYVRPSFGSHGTTRTGRPSGRRANLHGPTSTSFAAENTSGGEGCLSPPTVTIAIINAVGIEATRQYSLLRLGPPVFCFCPAQQCNLS